MTVLSGADLVLPDRILTPGTIVIAPGAVADLVILDAQLAIVRTYIDGKLAYSRDTPETPTRHL